MRGPARCLSIVTLLTLFTASWCGSIRIACKPDISLADGVSLITIQANVRNSSGNTVPDGTIVRFTSTLGSFRDVDVMTASGVARAVLVAPSTPGVAKITATVSSIGTISTLDYEFVGDKSLLSNFRRFIEVSSNGNLFYTNDIKVISASAEDKSATVKYRDLTIRARDLQVNLAQMKVVATNAEVMADGKPIECAFLRYSLNQRRGVAIATVDGQKGGYAITGTAFAPSEEGVMPSEFEFADIGVGATSVHASRIVAFPGRQLQFHDAELYVGDSKIMSVNLYALDYNSPNGLFSEQVVGFENGGLQLNYPYYLQLSPHQTSVFRLRSGDSYSRGFNSSRGLFLDLENTYAVGENGDGSLTLAGIGRSDMGLSWHHAQRFDAQTSASASLDFPGFDSVYGGINAVRQFHGFNANLNGSSTRTLHGTEYKSERLDFNVETDMKRIAGTQIMQSVGLTAMSSSASIASTNTRQEGYGLRGRWNLLPVQLWPSASMTAGVTVKQLWGDGPGAGLNILGTVGMSMNLGSTTYAHFSYDYAQDSLNTALLGRHRVGTEIASDFGRFNLHVFGSKSIDIDSYNLFADASWKLSKQWRLGGSFSMDRYIGDSVQDHFLVLGYTMGLREIGLTYSIQNKRFGFQILNVAFR